MAQSLQVKRFFWSKEAKVKLSFIQPGKPSQNAFCESVNGKFRNEWLNQHWCCSLEEARHRVSQWRAHYNNLRPHSLLGYQSQWILWKRQRKLCLESNWRWGINLEKSSTGMHKSCNFYVSIPHSVSPVQRCIWNLLISRRSLHSCWKECHCLA